MIKLLLIILGSYSSLFADFTFLPKNLVLEQDIMMHIISDLDESYDISQPIKVYKGFVLLSEEDQHLEMRRFFINNEEKFLLKAPYALSKLIDENDLVLIEDRNQFVYQDLAKTWHCYWGVISTQVFNASSLEVGELKKLSVTKAHSLRHVFNDAEVQNVKYYESLSLEPEDQSFIVSKGLFQVKSSAQPECLYYQGKTKKGKFLIEEIRFQR